MSTDLSSHTGSFTLLPWHEEWESDEGMRIADLKAGALVALGRLRHGTQRKSEKGSWVIANTVVGTQFQVGTVSNPWALQM